MNRAVKKNLVMFIVFAMCISLFFSMKPLAVNANSEVNAAVSDSDGCKWVEINNGLYGGDVYSLAIDPTNTQTIYAGTDGGVFKYICSSAAPPSPPQNLQANASASSIVLSWQPSTQGTYPIAGYAIYRGITWGGESSTLIATVDSNTTTYVDPK